MPNTSSLQLSLMDIAELAQVKRPVVSMWRKRPVAGHAFPAPVATQQGQERFDAFEVADYLQATGRGNTAVAREDIAAHASLAITSTLTDDTVFEGLTALLALSQASGESLAELTTGQLRDLAVAHDPRDSLLRREVEALGADASPFATHADALADASYSCPSAFELLLDQRTRRGLMDLSAVALRPEATELAARVAVALATGAGWQSPLFVDVTESGGDLLLATTRAYAAGPAPSIATLALDTPLARLARRRLLVHDLHRVDIHSKDGDLDTGDAHGDGTVHVLHLPDAAHALMNDVELLDSVSRLVDQLAVDSRVVVLGPAGALTDRPKTAEIDRARDAVLRSGRLRAAVRLPIGQLVRMPRRPLALWVLGPAHPDLAIAERWTVVGDLTDRSLTEPVIDDVIGDVMASLTAPAQARSHAYRFGRRVLTSVLIPGRRALVDRPVRRLKTSPVETLGDAVRAGHCRVVPGHRVAAEHLGRDGRRVVGPDELIGQSPVGLRTVDLLAFAAQYPAARYTEPGDVVFCTSPRVAAWVDHDGGSLVLAPARIIRLVTDSDEGPPPLLSDVVAADITAAGSGGTSAKDWRRWPLRLVPNGEIDSLRTELARLRDRRTTVTAQLAALEAETAQLIDRSTRPRPEGP